MMKDLESKIDRLCDQVCSMDKNLSIYNIQLGEHMRRTELLEAEVKILAKVQQRILGGFILAQFAIPILFKFIL